MKTSLLVVSAVVAFLAVGFVVTREAEAAPPATAYVRSNDHTIKKPGVFTAEMPPVVPTGYATWDFPEVGGGAVTCSPSATLVMDSTLNINASNGCIASTDWGLDGGSVALYFRADIRCRAVTNGIIFEACNWSSDGGTQAGINLPDSGFFGRIIR